MSASHGFHSLDAADSGAKRDLTGTRWRSNGGKGGTETGEFSRERERKQLLAAGLSRERGIFQFFLLISRRDTLCYCLVEERKSIFQSVCQSQVRARTIQVSACVHVTSLKNISQLLLCLLNEADRGCSDTTTQSSKDVSMFFDAPFWTEYQMSPNGVLSISRDIRL